MTALVINRHLSTPRAKKFRETMVMRGFKRIQRWVLDIEDANIQSKMRHEALNLRQTQEMREWDDFSVEQMRNLEAEND